jgi:hypothetical protein
MISLQAIGPCEHVHLRTQLVMASGFSFKRVVLWPNVASHFHAKGVGFGHYSAPWQTESERRLSP